MVGIANVGNSTPRLSSKRSIALIRPIVPTWTMSSMGSLRERNREAANFTRARLSSTRVLRTYANSCVPSSSDSSRSKRVLDSALASTGPTSSYGGISGRPSISAISASSDSAGIGWEGI